MFARGTAYNSFKNQFFNKQKSKFIMIIIIDFGKKNFFT